MNKHTPGPWRVDDSDEEDLKVVGRPTWKCKRYGVLGEWDVCRVDELNWDNTGEVAANARLIAAAPELLEALKAWDRWDYEVQSAKANGESVYSFQDLVYMRVKASQLSYDAIQKATGAA